LAKEDEKVTIQGDTRVRWVLASAPLPSASPRRACAHPRRDTRGGTQLGSGGEGTGGERRASHLLSTWRVTFRAFGSRAINSNRYVVHVSVAGSTLGTHFFFSLFFYPLLP
jgi:hypothetical protein